jgi:N-acetylmuramoyl-L-alanine amidase
MTRFALAFLLALAAGCATGPRIDDSYRAKSQDSRVQYLIIHYTTGNFAGAFNILTVGGVSSHYLVRDDDPPTIYRLVDENRRAYHAGVSSWKGQTALNAASIGIEIVNAGDVLTNGEITYADYPKPQVDAVVALVKDIVARHEIRGDRILGHSDIAPQRKVDPGPKFPWKRLADEGLIPWPDPKRVAGRKAAYEQSLPDVAWFQGKLAEHGFALAQNGEFDEATIRVIAAFQMKYRPAKYDGQPDAETAAILDVMTSAPANAP